MSTIPVTIQPSEVLPSYWEVEMLIEDRLAVDPYSDRPGLIIGNQWDHIQISGLYVPLRMRRQGLARALMTRALEYIDAMWPHLPVLLDARPFGVDALLREKLFAFYSSVGFQRWPDHPVSMVRWPKEGARTL